MDGSPALPTDAASEEPLALRAADGYRLGGTLFVPKRARAVVVLSGATGIPHAFYKRFARFLAQREYACLSYDYRGVGASRPPRLRGFRARMRDWGQLDQRGALAEARRQFPDLPLVSLGHSVGGQLLAAAVTPQTMPAAVVQVACSTGVWWHFPPAFALYCAAMWYAGMPLATRTLGYFPASRFGLGEDLPAGVAREWARWCCRGDYCGELRHADPAVDFDAVRAPAYALAFADDRIANRRTVGGLHALYRGLKPVTRWVRPREFGLDKIGHVDFFSSRMPPALWRLPVDWLDRVLGDLAAAA